MDDLSSNPLFILAVLDPPPPDCAINAVRSAYYTVFGRNPPADEWDNQLLLWLRVCVELGADHAIVKTTRRFFHSLPDLSSSKWNVAGRLLYFPEALETVRALLQWSGFIPIPSIAHCSLQDDLCLPVYAMSSEWGRTPRAEYVASA